ncbi:MAG TPA: DedA family protein [Candidatus Tectomicrobia bacterium]|jgi:membrane-associated protein
MGHLIEVFLHLDKYLYVVMQEYGVWTYSLLFLIIFLETGVVVTPFLPGDSLLFAAGALAATGALSAPWLFVLLFVAAVLGDTANYWIGHAVGPRAFSGHSRFLKKEHLDRTQEFYIRHGGKTIFLARFVPIIRTFAPFVAGVGRMDYGRFIFYNIFGALVWTALFIFGGYAFGNVSLVKRHFSLVVLAIIVLSLMPIGIEFLQQRRRKAQPAETP